MGAMSCRVLAVRCSRASLAHCLSFNNTAMLVEKNITYAQLINLALALLLPALIRLRTSCYWT